MTAWIKMIADEDADPALLEVLKLARTPHGTVDNVMRVHSLRPNTMRGHVVLYRAALHDEANTLPTWLQETLSSYVSILNNCDYSLANHWANARHWVFARAGESCRRTPVRSPLEATPLPDFRAKVMPSRHLDTLSQDEIKKLWQASKYIIKKAIDKKGTTFSDYRNADGGRGGFADFLKVYGRQDKKCLRCKKSNIKKIKLAGRGTHFCASCQK